MLKPVSLSVLNEAISGKMLGNDVQVSNVSIDTRAIQQGDLYIALKGEHFDGHQFVEQAALKKCIAVVVSDLSVLERVVKDYAVSGLCVENTLRALGECGRINRQQFKGAVVGLTGSSGKTTTKNMLESILSEKGPTCATQGNYNNEVGVPLTLLNIKSEHQFAVVEMGARKIGDIKYLADFVQPDVAILLNAGTAHIDVFGSQENIVKGKGEIYSSLKKEGCAVVNFDDPAKDIWLAALEDRKVLTFSLECADADIYASAIETDSATCKFVINHNGICEEIFLPMPGKHNILNSLAASAAAIHLGFDLQTIASGLKKLNSVAGRLLSIPCNENLEVIDDSYNANPASMKAAIEVLSARAGFKIAVLGEMAELGDFSKKLHLELAKFIAQSEIDKVYLLGTYAQEMKQVLGTKAIAAESKLAVLDSLEKTDHIFEIKQDDSALVKTSILIKGSRSTSMDELVEMIIKRAH